MEVRTQPEAHKNNVCITRISPPRCLHCTRYSHPNNTPC